MKKFNIKVLDRKPKKMAGKWYYEAKITIGDYAEIFFVPVDYWNINQYEAQWQEGMNRLRTHDTSCLVGSVKKCNNIIGTNLWVLYKIEGTVFVQNHVRTDEVQKELEKNFPPYNDLLPREAPEEGRPDEWCISADDFFASIDENIEQLRN